MLDICLPIKTVILQLQINHIYRRLTPEMYHISQRGMCFFHVRLWSDAHIALLHCALAPIRVTSHNLFL